MHPIPYNTVYVQLLSSGFTQQMRMCKGLSSLTFISSEYEYLYWEADTTFFSQSKEEAEFQCIGKKKKN